ncbi:hypothetical protein AB0N06_23245 [Streptomyces sp. NPDC051020]|uniref:hypothetical protein n=1 Tax=Streptomyces sp. NPDC051020 TaxID=3155409 RepID=UPI003432DB21
MTATQLLYASHPTDRSGAALETAAQPAKLVGMAQPVFAPTRKQIPDRRLGERVVVPLRRAT